MVYRLSCNECSQEIVVEDTYNYVGCTRTSVHARMAGHLKLQKQKNSSGALYRHDLEIHNGVTQEYSAEVLGKEKKILRLYTLEAKLIEKQKPGLSMNDRQERTRTILSLDYCPKINYCPNTKLIIVSNLCFHL